ncbi:MAG TPA: TIGR02391 family protein [Xanthobacteraceae bacterium]|jgi:uncharacterized protein (TIGR02391 family)|nr:TIGR02391 family protein [Xanthobacteraceae bacterium]
MARRPSIPTIEPKIFKNAAEIDRAIVQLQRRIKELEQIDFVAAVLQHTGLDSIAENNIRNTILEIYGPNSPEYDQHKHLSIWAGGMFVDMDDQEIIQGKIQGKTQTIGILSGLIGRLSEAREDLDGGHSASTSLNFEKWNLHPRVADVARDLFADGHHFEAVFAASKALVNFVKERSGQYDLDGAALMRTVFSKNNPILVFSDLADQTDLDQQEGLMHLFEGAVLSIRNPGGHAFPEGTERRAIEYISLLSLLAYLVQEARKRPRPA